MENIKNDAQFKLILSSQNSKNKRRKPTKKYGKVVLRTVQLWMLIASVQLHLTLMAGFTNEVNLGLKH